MWKDRGDIMAYTINANAKNVWIRDNEDTRDLSIQTDASSVYLDNGRTLEQELGEGSMVSNVATVDSAMSKIIDGTLDGVYESLVFKGKSLVNLINYNDSIVSVSSKYVQFSSMIREVIGATVTVFNFGDKEVRMQTSVEGAYSRQLYFTPNAKTLVKLNPNEKLERIRGSQTNGWELNEASLNELKNSTMVIEGDYTNMDVPYFEGLGSCKMPILRNVGKNLYEGKDYQRDVEANKSTGNFPLIMSHVKLKKNTDYRISYSYETNTTRNDTTYGLLTKTKVERLDAHNALYSYHHDDYEGNGKKGNSKQLTQARFNTGDFEYLYFGVNSTSAGQNGYIKYYNIQLEESSSPTPYESHKTNILRTSEEIVLREVNGVQDTYNPLTGEYVKRIGEVAITGAIAKSVIVLDKNVRVNIAMSALNGDNGTTKTNNTLSDKFYWSEANARDIEGLRVNGNTFHWCISRDKLTSQDLQGVNTWLQSNPITVQYELAEPVTTIIEPNTMPFAYENGHIILSSGYEGQSLLPVLEYSTVVGRTGQIQSIAKMTRRHEEKLTMLEQMLVTNILAMDYENTLLALNLEMDEVI